MREELAEEIRQAEQDAIDSAELLGTTPLGLQPSSDSLRPISALGGRRGLLHHRVFAGVLGFFTVRGVTSIHGATSIPPATSPSSRVLCERTA